MKLIALTAGDYKISLPSQINTLNNNAGKYGGNIIKLAVDVLILGAVLSCLIFIIYGGFKWMVSQGDKKKVEDARNTLVFSVVGLILVMLAYFIINILGAFFNVPILLGQ